MTGIARERSLDEVHELMKVDAAVSGDIDEIHDLIRLLLHFDLLELDKAAAARLQTVHAPRLTTSSLVLLTMPDGGHPRPAMKRIS